MKSVTNITSSSDDTFDALLDEINHQKRIITQIQTENRKLKTNEIRLNKTTESLKAENHAFSQEIQSLVQKIRELEIELTLPTNERKFTISHTIDPYPKRTYARIQLGVCYYPNFGCFGCFLSANGGRNASTIPPHQWLL